MKKYLKRSIAFLLCIFMFGQMINAVALANEFAPEYRFFEDAVITADGAEQDQFLFGSRSMTVSEKSKDRYIMKIVRTGDCETEAEVTVKFTDVSANYGENYTVSVYDGNEKPVVSEGRTSIVDFFVENADTQEEIPNTSAEELLELIGESGGYDTLDAEGNVVSRVSITSGADENADGLSVADIGEACEAQAITADDSDMINDYFPGTELRLSFAAGEKERYIAVTPKYSKKADGDCIAVIALKDPSEGYAVYEDTFTTYLTITDEDESEDAVISIEKSEYRADGDSVSVTVTRSGAINELVSVNICTVPDTAEIGYDFQGMDAELFFPMGVTSRTVDIPVNHTSEDEELTFDVKLVNPVNCKAEVSEALVSISPAAAGASDMLLASEQDTYGAYLADRLWPSDFTCFGNAWNTDAYWLKYSCKGVDYDTWNGGKYYFENPYLYDGVRVEWEAWHNGWGSISYTYINTDNQHVWYSEENEWDSRTNDVIFGKKYNKELWIGSLTSYFNGIQVNVKRVRPIYRTFNFNLADADQLDFIGVDKAEARTYTAAQFAGPSDTVKTMNTSVGGCFTVSAPQSQIEYAHLAGLSFLDANGNEIYYLANDTNTRSVTVNVTKELMSRLACETLEYVKQSDGRYIGNITVKPVFEYIDSAVTVKPSAFGAFTGELETGSVEKKLTYHLGDRITLSSAVSASYAGKYVPDGIRFEKRDAEGKLLPGGSGGLDYNADGELEYIVDSPVISLTPVFRENDNAVRVQVLRRDVNNGVFDLDSGIFAMNRGRTVSGDYYVYTVSDSSVHLDQLFSLNATPADEGRVSVWSVPGAANDYSGNTFYFGAAREKESNLITLSAAVADSFSFSGYVFNADKNLSTGNASAAPVIPAEGALICAGTQNATAFDDGSFYLEGVRGSASTCVRLMIFNNNSYTFKDVRLNGTENDYNLGLITAAANCTDSAYFTNVYCYQDGRLITSTETLGMNGKALEMYASVKDGNKYTVNGTEYTESVTGVTFYVLDGTTHEIKSSYPAAEYSDGAWRAVINRFTPDAPESYYYGDCVYVSMTTDRIRGDVTDEDGNTPEAFLSTDYAMLSTGYQIIKDQTYTPQKFSMNLPISAELNVKNVGDGKASQNVKKSYAAFPFIGSIDFTAGVKGVLKTVRSVAGGAESMEEIEDADYISDEEDPGMNINEKGESVGGEYAKFQFRITASTEMLPYGGTRLKFGMTAATGNSAWGRSMGYNPLETYRLAAGRKETGDDAKELLSNNRNGIKNTHDVFKSTFGTPKMVFNVSFGIYVDFGIIQSTDLETGETTGLTDSDWVFLGVGGYLGGSFTAEIQWITVIPIIYLPGYWGFTGTIGATGFLGADKDPEKVLDYSGVIDDDGTFNADKLHFNVEVYGDASIKGHLGIGLPDVVGVRVIGGFKLSGAYSPYMMDYYKQIDETWGIGGDLTLGGQIDVVVTRIPVEGFSVPLFSYGFTEYFVTLKRCNKLVDLTLQAIEENIGGFSEDYLSRARKLADQLAADIENDESLSQLQKDFAALLAYVYNDSRQLITTNQRNNVYMVTPYDVWLTSSSSGTDYEVMEHTDSKWLANRGMIENAAFQEAVTQLIVRDSYSQPTSKLMDIGGGCLLATFLMDTSKKGETVDPTLVYTVYDTETEEWTDPEPFQNDGTVDYTPSVCDAGDKVLVTWSSAKKAYEEYGSECELMQDLEIYSVFFDKKTQKVIGEPQQLTDDEYMDYKPSAIYDSESGDIAVYYLKNDTDSDEITDYITDESLTCYRLYDSSTGTWVVDYYENEYPSYTEEARHTLAERYGGQRFLTSSAGNDLPISDLAVCEGYNGLGVYAYTVDMDGDVSTNGDTELYIRVYDFRTHKTYKPIRITNDDVSQALPQLVRNDVPYTDYFDDETGKEVGGTTYLFWLENDNQVKYISVTDLIRNGINEDGTLKTEGYRLNPVHINTELSDGSPSSVSSYQALTDNDDNLYIVWTQTCADDFDGEDVTTPAALEIYAAAQINPGTDDAYDAAARTGGTVGKTWSAPYRLTRSGKCNDGVAGIAAENGKLYLMHNRYSVQYVGGTDKYMAENRINAEGFQSGNPYEISSTDLMLTTFEPIGTVSATEFSFSDSSPRAGDVVTVTAKVENTGLTTAKGYTVSFNESKNGRSGKEIKTFTINESLAANASRELSFEWTVPEDFDGMSIECVAVESGFENKTVTESEPLKSEAVYDVNIVSLKQTGDRFRAEYTVENSGNAPAKSGDVMEISFAALYGRYDTLYGLETPLLASVSMAGLGAKSKKTYVTEFSVPEKAFEYCGYDEALFEVKNADGKALTYAESAKLVLEEPISVKFNCGDSLSLEAGKSAKADVKIENSFLGARANVIYSTDDTGVITVADDGTVTAVGEGSASVKAYIAPFGTEITLPVTVSGNIEPTPTPVPTPGPDEDDTKTPDFTDVSESDYYYDAVEWAVSKDVTNGVSKTEFAPFVPCTRAQMVTFLWRAAGCPEAGTDACFTDVSEDSYYAEAVSWAAEKGITKGTSESEFSPDLTVTRAQTVTFLYRFASAAKAEADNPFRDVYATDYYYDAVLWAYQNGITTGTTADTFTPNADCTRAQIVTFLYRFFN